MSGGFLARGGFCPGGFCPGVYVRGVFVLEPLTSALVIYIRDIDIDPPAGRGIRPKALQLSAMIRLASDSHSTMGNANLLVQSHK